MAGRLRRKFTFEQLGKYCEQYELGLLVTTPAYYNTPTSRIAGWQYKAQQGKSVWQKTKVRTENAVVYDAMYLEDLKTYKRAYKQLRRNLERFKTPYFNPVLPAKDAVYRVLEQAPLRYGRLPATLYNVTGADVLRMLQESPRIWLKPTFGSGGRNMAFIERLSPRRYRVAADRFFGKRVRQEMDSIELRAFVHAARKQRNYMAQEHVSLLKTPEGRKVDFRYTVQRAETGKWDVVAVTGRFGALGSELTNFHAGGEVKSLTFESEERKAVLESLQLPESSLFHAGNLALTVAQRLEQVHPTLGVLGIDVGIAQDKTQYVYDCNGRPGRDILTNAEVDAAMKSVAGFGKFLLLHHRAPVF